MWTSSVGGTAQNLTWSEDTLTITSSASTAITATNQYMIDAARWGAEAGEEWARDVAEQEAEWIAGVENQLATRALFEPDWIFSNGTGALEPTQVTYRPVRLDLTAEQIEAARRAAEDHGRAKREAEYRSDRAEWKATELLLRHLTPRQAEDYLERGRFTVITKRKHRYVIGKARSQNVVRVNRRGKPMRVYCVTVHGSVPIADALLGQKLMLDHDEDHFLRVARQWPVRFALGVGGIVRRSVPTYRLGDALYYPGRTDTVATLISEAA